MDILERHIEINGRRITSGYPTYIIAEMSANHNQEFNRAVRIIEAAKKSGADAIKLQTFTPDTHTIDSDSRYFRLKGGTPWDDQTLYDLYRHAYMPWEWQPKLMKIANDIGLDLFSAAVDPSSVDFLEQMDVPVHKITSFEILDIPLIEKMVQTGKPLLISTGMATFSEIDEAVDAAINAGAKQLALLKCTSAYPAPPEEMNLRAIPHLSDTFHVPIGLSDHTIGTTIPIVAVSLGACIVEKHFTLSRADNSPDSSFSLEPSEFKAMVDAIRTAEKAFGCVNYQVTEREKASREFRRSLFVIQEVKAGDIFTHDNIRSIRPGQGLHPRHLKELIGLRATRDIPRGTPLSWDLIDKRGD